MHARKHHNFSTLGLNVFDHSDILFTGRWVARAMIGQFKEEGMRGHQVAPEKIVRNEKGANSPSLASESDMVWSIPCTIFIGSQHFEEPEMDEYVYFFEEVWWRTDPVPRPPSQI